MKFLLSICLVVCCFSLFAQEKLELRTRYYSKEDKLLDNSEGAYYYTYDTVGSEYGAYSYYLASNKLKRVVGPGIPDSVHHEIWYYENGNVELEGSIKRTIPVGRMSMWHSNGQHIAEVEFIPAKNVYTYDSKVIQYWDSLGTQLVKDGNGTGYFKFPEYIDGGTGSFVDGWKDGTWKGDLKKATYEERYDHGKFIEGASISEGKTYKYTVIEQPAELVKGLPELFRKLKNNLEYPRAARKAGLQGSVFVEFVVLDNGQMTDFKVIKGFDPQCDASALNTMKNMSLQWKPGLRRGLPVKVRFVLPIKFVLG